MDEIRHSCGYPRHPVLHTVQPHLVTHAKTHVSSRKMLSIEGTTSIIGEVLLTGRVRVAQQRKLELT